jgi:hypothetical protein
MPRTSSVTLTRRAFIGAAGASIALPLLDAMATSSESPRRLVAICNGLGFHAENLFPEKPGKDYKVTTYLKHLETYRSQLTLFGGVSHPEVDGGHTSESCFLTAAPHPSLPSFRNTISLDQFVVERLRPDTRYPYLALSTHAGGSIAVTRAGVSIPTEDRPSLLFKKLFLNGTAAEIKQQIARLRDGRSMMDGVVEEIKTFKTNVGAKDRERLEQYLTSVREVEQRLNQAEAWARKPKPKVAMTQPTDVTSQADIVARTRLMLDLVHLALQTDSSRIITLHLKGVAGVPPIVGVSQDWHTLSHHGKDPEKLAQLRLIELEIIKVFGNFLEKLKTTKENSGSLLDNTAVLLGSNLGNASSHSTANLPVMVAGGGFTHGGYLAFDEKRNAPLCNLFVTLAQWLCAKSHQPVTGSASHDIEKFGNSTASSLKGFEIKG